MVAMFLKWPSKESKYGKLKKGIMANGLDGYMEGYLCKAAVLGTRV